MFLKNIIFMGASKGFFYGTKTKYSFFCFFFLLPCRFKAMLLARFGVWGLAKPSDHRAHPRFIPLRFQMPDEKIASHASLVLVAFSFITLTFNCDSRYQLLVASC
jgi:hypothetical protein